MVVFGASVRAGTSAAIPLPRASDDSAAGVKIGTWSGRGVGTLAGVMIIGLWIVRGAISGEKSLPLRVTLARRRKSSDAGRK